MVRSIFAPDVFRSRVALITGGATGIGLRTAREFLQLGGCVFICSRKGDLIAQTVARLNEEFPPFTPTSTPRVAGTACNIRDPASIASLCSFISSLPLLGSDSSLVPPPPARVDYLVNNAGGQFPSLASAISHKGWQAVVDTNLTGTFLVSQAIFNNFFGKQAQAEEKAASTAAAGGASSSSSTAASAPPSSAACRNPLGGCAIVNILCNMHRGFPGMSHTGAARAAMANLTMSLAVEWAQEGVRVNALAPGVIQSSGLSNYDTQMQELIATNSSKHTYASRLGTEAESAACILFLLSPGAAFVTGACLNLDGGESLYSPMMPPVAHQLNRAWDDEEQQQPTKGIAEATSNDASSSWRENADAPPPFSSTSSSSSSGSKSKTKSPLPYTIGAKPQLSSKL